MQLDKPLSVHLKRMYPLCQKKAIKYIQAHLMGTVPTYTLRNWVLLGTVLKERHSVVGFYTVPQSILPEGQTEELFRMLEERFLF